MNTWRRSEALARNGIEPVEGVWRTSRVSPRPSRELRSPSPPSEPLRWSWAG